jgi:hypothetical protein
MRKLQVFGCIFAAVIVGAGCRGESDSREVSTPAVRTPLIDGFVSRQSTTEVEARLRQAAARITVVEDGKATEQVSNFRTPLSLRVLNVAGFNYLGMQGDLRLEFVDSELAATWFFPDDPVRFESEIGKQMPSAASSPPMRLHPATELRVNVDYRGRKYWAWEDVNLRQKVDQWIKKNA